MIRLLLFFIFSIQLLHSQNDSKFFAKSIEWNIAENLITKDSIYALDIGFPNNISDFHFDTINAILISYFSLLNVDGGQSDFDKIAAYSLKDRKLLWVKLVNRKKQKYQVSDSSLYLNDLKKGEAKRLDITSHKELWKARTFLYHLPSKTYSKDLILGTTYEVLSGPIEIQGINPSNGKMKWSNRNVEIKKNTVQQAFINDSILILISEYLYGINLYTGEEWTYDYKFNKVKTKSEHGETYAFIAGGLLGLAIYRAIDGSMPYTELNYYKRCSNILSQPDCFFISNDQNLFKFNYSGELLSKSMHILSGESKLIEVKDKLYLISLGNYNGFVNLYDTSGNFKKSYNRFIGKKRPSLRILDFNFSNNLMTLLDQSRLILLDTSLVVKADKEYKAGESESWRALVKKNFYLKQSDSFTFENVVSSENTYVTLVDKSIKKYDLDFNLVNTISKLDACYEIYTDHRLQVLKNSNDNAYFIDKRTSKVALQMNGLRKIIEHKNKLYIAALNGFYVIDKNEFF